MTAENPLLQAALAYASCGWPVFPCNPANKRPLVKGDVNAQGQEIPDTGGVKQASTDPDTIRRWWARWPKAMIGLATGAVSGVFVVDIDAGFDEDTGEAFEACDLLAHLQAELGCELPDTWSTETPRGGRHLFFQFPCDSALGNRTNLIKRVDVRGEGGYVILPPSARPDGSAYVWGANQPAAKDALPAEAPPALIDCILRSGKWARDLRPSGMKATEKTRRRAPLRLAAADGKLIGRFSAAGDAAVRRYAAAALEKEIRGVERAGRGDRNNRLNIAAFRLGELIGAGALDEEEVRAKLEAAAVGNGLVKEDGMRAVRNTIESGLGDGKRAPRDLAEIRRKAEERAARYATAVDTPQGEDGAPPADPPSEGSNSQGSGGRQRAPQRDVLIGLTEFVELWHDASRTAYASFQVGAHHEHWPVRSREFRMWLSGRFYEETGGAIGGQALEDGLRILEARAINEGPPYECFTRVGHADGKTYLDLGEPSWRAVEITAIGWRVIDDPPIKLLRSPSMRPLPTPEVGSRIEKLRDFVNVKTNNDFILVVAWLVAAFRHRGPFPILDFNGESGSAKSFASRIVRSLVDPRAAPIRAAPRDERDLVISANNSWALAFDNLSSVPAWLADALCRLATGSGFATRTLNTDRDETIFEAARPIIINGIPTLTDRADLADRTLTIPLRAIPEDERRGETELWAEFEQARPRILGALLDAVSCALANIGSVKLDRVPRMADFAQWIVAAEPGLGWESGAFLGAYTVNRRDVAETAFEADAVAVAIDKLINPELPEGFQGTATELLNALNNVVTESTRKSKYWPQDAARLGNRVSRAARLLRAKGYIIDRRHSGDRTITILPPQIEVRQIPSGDDRVPV
jgi:Bifunctional DNA primase/polymerase, N-terminal